MDDLMTGKGKRKGVTWKKYHRWMGVVFAVFVLLFCLSGIVLNHRSLFSGCQVSRAWLPASYRFHLYNNGIVKGTLKLQEPVGGLKDRVLAYGCAGVWLTDSCFSEFQDFNAGLPDGVDGRNIRNVVQDGGTLWCAALYHVYRHDGKRWVMQPLDSDGERISDLTPDRYGRVTVLTRSAVFRMTPSDVHGGSDSCRFVRQELKAPEGYVSRVSLFKTVWMLHSGELFGLVGRLVVDLMAVVLAVLCVTGIVLFILPYRIRRNNRKGAVEAARRDARLMKWNLLWHNRLGVWSLVLTLLLAVTGMCLRPPLMIPLVLTHTAPLPGSVQDQENVWHDKLRAIRWDDQSDRWLISTSEGFITVDEQFRHSPVQIPSVKAPTVSPMGVNVWVQERPGTWVVGSFSGMFRWEPDSGKVTDYFTGQLCAKPSGRPVGRMMVSGYSADLDRPDPVVFAYDKGAEGLPPMPVLLTSQPMSLWNFALELHVGRCYTPFLGPLSDLFVFLSGLLLTLILISGYIIHRRQHRKRG